MNAKIVKTFLNKNVKLVKNKFPLYGKIIGVQDDYIIFQTKQTTSVISLSAIEEITPIDNKEDKLWSLKKSC